MIELIKGNHYYGFSLDEIDELDDIHSVGYLFTHKKSGARLFYVQNKDDNKVFFISFKTPPEDDCGTPHILEHSVLCGSRKYQAKDPFNELAKGSLNTYLNALTYADKTMYPIASRNEKDFMNMMDVYLDATFYPKIYDQKEIFMQEGWHNTLEDEKSPLSITGVVYNEMKGALSDPESILSNCISRSLFPHSIYRFESGGDPEAIPNLTYEKFLNFHRKYYHPSNSYIYLYGDMDIEKQLQLLDQEYLSHFDNIDSCPEILAELDFSEPAMLYDTYPVVTGESGKRNTYLSYNIRIGKSTDPELIMAFDILSYILLETNASPLKKVLIEEGIVEETEGWFDSSTYEMVFSIIGKKSEKENLQRFQNIIEKTLKQIVDEGIDKKLVEATLNKWEFHLREEDYGYRPKGLTYGMKMMKSWLHGADPMNPLMLWKHFESVKTALTSDYFERLIQKYILKNKNKSIVAVSPEEGKQTKIDEAFSTKMKQIKSEMAREELKAIIENNKILASYQSREETPETLGQIPILSIDEISKEAEVLESKEIDMDEYKLLFTPMETNGIIYSQLLFDTRYVPQSLLPYTGLLTDIIGKLDTIQYSYDDLPVAINLHTGGIGLSNDIYSKNKEDYISLVAVNGKTLAKQTKIFFRLISEILLATDFAKKENIEKIIKASKIKLKSYLLNSSHMAAVVRSVSSFSAGSRIKDITSGIEYFRFLSQVEENLEDMLDEVIEKLVETASYLFTKENLMVAVSCEKKDLTLYQTELHKLYESLPASKGSVQQYAFDFSVRRSAFTGASKVQYNVKSANYMDYGFTYSGKMQVLKTVLDLEYLWNRVRVQGGAYGCGCQFLKNGSLYFYSYRDPNIEKTFSSYDETEAFLNNFRIDEREMTKYILGTVNALDRPRSNAEKSDLAVARYFCQITPQGIQKERNEILSTTADELKEYIPLLQKAMAEDILCTVGNINLIEEQKSLYQSIVSFLP